MSLLALALVPFVCAAPIRVHDGDGPIRCANSRLVFRLVSIDAPEVAGSPACSPGKRRWHDCDFARGEIARAALQRLLDRARVVRVVPGDLDHFGKRTLAKISIDGVDVECRMVAAGQAKARYAALAC